MKEKYDFCFYYNDKVRTTNDKNEALGIFRCGGFYKAVCYFPRYGGFRLLENKEDFDL